MIGPLGEEAKCLAAIPAKCVEVRQFEQLFFCRAGMRHFFIIVAEMSIKHACFLICQKG